MIFQYVNIKNSRKFQSYNSRIKKGMQRRFSGLTQKINISYLLFYYEKPKSQTVPSALEAIS